MGRGPQSATGNDVVIQEKRVSNKHCRMMLGLTGKREDFGDGEPDVWIEDLKSSNGTFVSFSVFFSGTGVRLTSRSTGRD